MCIIANHVHYVMKINQAFPIFLVYVEKHGKAWVGGYEDHTVTAKSPCTRNHWLYHLKSSNPLLASAIIIMTAQCY